MRYAILTDIHGNLEALEAVLAKIDELALEESIDQVWFLGDLVGYGSNPNECIVTLRERTNVIIAGNHDWAAVGKLDLEEFSAAARISAEWTAKQLTEEHRDFLADLPERLDIGDCTLVHGSPYGPLWEYLTSEVLAERSFKHFNSRYCFVGHTHIPSIFQQIDDTIANTPTIPLSTDPSADDESTNDTEPLTLPDAEETEEETIQTTIVDAEDRLNREVEELLALLGLSQSMVMVTNEMITPPEGDWTAPDGYRLIVNPGGVGQPRDGDPRAAFMLYDTERGFSFYRIPYLYEKTQEKIIKAGLPPYLAARLSYGR